MLKTSTSLLRIMATFFGPKWWPSIQYNLLLWPSPPNYYADCKHKHISTKIIQTSTLWVIAYPIRALIFLSTIVFSLSICKWKCMVWKWCGNKMSVEISQLLLWTWNDERFFFFTTALGKNFLYTCTLILQAKFLPSEVVKKENLSSFHGNRMFFSFCLDWFCA